MKCTYCGAELEYHDYYGRICAHQDGEILGEIFKCPNHEGFENYDDAMAYFYKRESQNNPIDVAFDWREIICDSSYHHVSGSFYTDSKGELHV